MTDKPQTQMTACFTESEREAYEEGREARRSGRSITKADLYTPQWLATAFRLGWCDEDERNGR